MVLKNTKPTKKSGHQSLRGKPREFSDPCEFPEDSSNESSSGSDSDVEQVVGGMKEPAQKGDDEPREQVKATPKAPTMSKAPVREVTRREREAAEKEQARQHYLRMKEKEDAARLAVVRKQREEAAMRHAEEQRAKQRRP